MRQCLDACQLQKIPATRVIALQHEIDRGEDYGRVLRLGLWREISWEKEGSKKGWKQEVSALWENDTRHCWDTNMAGYLMVRLTA